MVVETCKETLFRSWRVRKPVVQIRMCSHTIESECSTHTWMVPTDSPRFRNHCQRYPTTSLSNTPVVSRSPEVTCHGLQRGHALHAHQDGMFPCACSSMKDTSKYHHIFPGTHASRAHSVQIPFEGWATTGFTRRKGNKAQRAFVQIHV